MMRIKLPTFLAAALALCFTLASASVGLTELPGQKGDGPVTVFYPSSSDAAPVERGPFRLQVAWQGQTVPGNGRLVVLSHGSGGAAWPHSDLARKLVEAGFVVALPEHQGDNWHDMGKVGPASWKLRPLEVSRAIDQVLADPRLAPLVAPDRVGVFGMSAGGHTALTLAGGRWSPSQLLRHCEAHLDADFTTCAGPSTRLNGSLLDGVRKAVTLAVIRRRLDDAAWYRHEDPRIKAIVAEVPFAVDFDMATLAAPSVPLGLVRARQDIWLTPQFHINAVIKACPSCVLVADLPTAGHGSLLSPQPPGLSGNLAELLSDPPGFDRTLVPGTHEQIVNFFRKHLLP
jgi:predicted dienelactone hydrolase